jgi:hypothetical protein
MEGALGVIIVKSDGRSVVRAEKRLRGIIGKKIGAFVF